MQPIFTLAIHIVLEAFRTRFFGVVIALLSIGLGLTLFLGQITVTESQAIQSSVLAGFLRLSAVYIVSLFVITSMVREFNDHTIYLCLSLPMQRSSYLLGKLSGYALVALITAVLFSSVLFVYVPYLQVVLWTVSLLGELLIITALSLLCVLTFHHTVQAFSVVLGFYILARSINAIQLMAQSPLNDLHLWTNYFIHVSIKFVAMVLPDLERFTQSEWLVYHTGNLDNLLTITIQTSVYVLLLIAMSLFDLYRKNV